MMWVMFANIATTVCLTAAAIHFNKWWIILFLGIFHFTYERNNGGK